MNYSDEILENKAFNFFKQLMYNIALSICILLVGVLITVYGFGFKLFEVLSNSQAPYFVRGDMVIVKAQEKYEVGDIVLFQHGMDNVSHRLIYIYKDSKGVEQYIFHGDNVQSANPTSTEFIVPWEEDSAYIDGLFKEYGSKENIPSTLQPKDVQIKTKNAIVGKVVNHIDNLGSMVKFVKEHYLLVIALVAGVWCVSTVIQNEIDNKKTRRIL